MRGRNPKTGNKPICKSRLFFFTSFQRNPVNMKNPIIPISLAIVLMAGTQQNQGSAYVERIKGIDVYVMSKPLQPYEVIKSVEGINLLSCKEAINTPVNIAYKQKADAVIIYWPENNRYELIKYK